MNEFLSVTLLGILQGVAEFLPVSSSGHLVIAQDLLGVDNPGIRLDVFLHVGTVLAIFAYYRARIAAMITGLYSADAALRREAWAFAAKIIASAIPAVIVYGVFNSRINEFFDSSRMTGYLLMFTGVVLLGTRFLPKGSNPVGFSRALAMGLGQALALLPGVSRSGMTLAVARGVRVAPEAAAEFSFLMSTPIILGAAFLEVLKNLEGKAVADEPAWWLVIYGAAIAAVTGYFSLKWLVKILKGRFFWAFGPYCIIVGLLMACR